MLSHGLPLSGYPSLEPIGGIGWGLEKVRGRSRKGWDSGQKMGMLGEEDAQAGEEGMHDVDRAAWA
jgi:hypothetical protein